MHSCLILGCGRSGTSMVAGLLAGAGYNMGSKPHRPRRSNPKGFFETPEVNGINEELLAPLLPKVPSLSAGQRWLGIPQRECSPVASPELTQRMRECLREEPFCHKDPRFSFTLPAWRPLLGNARYLCIFRDPALTAASLLEECSAAPYLHGLEINSQHAFHLWMAHYSTLLQHSQAGEWRFLHYDQILDPNAIAELGTFLDATLDAGFPDPKLRRESTPLVAPDPARELYLELCRRARYREQPAVTQVTQKRKVSVLALVEDGQEPHLATLIQDVVEQRGVETELVLVDHTSNGLTVDVAHTCVRSTSPARAQAWLAGLAHCTQERVALAIPGVRWLPAHLAHALAVFDGRPELELCTTDYYLHDDHAQFVSRISPAAMGEVLGYAWEAGAVFARKALERLQPYAFFPSELALFQRLRREGRWANVTEAGCSLPRSLYTARWERAVQDACLVQLEDQSSTTTPLFSVSICTFNRCGVLRACLEAFARQLLPVGSYELVVVNDGSTDGTRELLDSLQLRVPLRVLHQDNAGLATARNAGLEQMRGRYVLFVNDDTIPFPDCIEQHLLRHEQAAQGTPNAVLGTFEQPKYALGNALLRYLESSNEIFDYASLAGKQTTDAFHFYTCNVSVPLASVRAVGGFDESFRHYGCEDTDLAFRMQAQGLRFLYEPKARAQHQHWMDFAYLKRRQRGLAAAYVRFFRKHPSALKEWGLSEYTALAASKALAAAASTVARDECAAAELANLDLASFERLGEAYNSTAECVIAGLKALLPQLNKHWWTEGWLQGFREQKLSGFAELLACAEAEHPFASDHARRLLAWPRWQSEQSLERLLELIEPIANDGFAALVLRHREERDGPLAAGLQRLQDCFGRRFAGAGNLQVLIEALPLARAEMLRLGRCVDAWLCVGDEPEEFVQAIQAERFTSESQVSAWRRRFLDPLQPAALARSALPQAPEITVIIPTHNRPRELKNLLALLARQDLPARLFEVVVVDDGSDPAIALQTASYPYAIRLLRQDAKGPGAARNRALQVARGSLIVFLNDDAVPAACNLSAHRRAHQARSESVAILGPFGLIRSRRQDSFADYIESSTALFAQSQMQAGASYQGLALCTGNVSLPRTALLAVQGFDESFCYAGGEDSELGLRLERALGMRVLYDPAAQCGHDHDLNVLGLYRRQRVIGWAAHRIHHKHADVKLIADWPYTTSRWRELERELRDSAPQVAYLLHELQTIADEEREQGCREGVENLRTAYELVRDQGFRQGLVLAERGLLPVDPYFDVATEPAPPAEASCVRAGVD